LIGGRGEANSIEDAHEDDGSENIELGELNVDD
jgi:hypothetical protein